MRYGICVFLIALGLFLSVGSGETAVDPEKQVLVSLEHYFQSWNTADDDERRKVLKGYWADDATYTDPTVHVDGLEALVKHIAGFQGNPQMKGFSIDRSSGIGVHHRSFRFQWEMKSPTGQVLTPGIDYGEFDDEGRITKIVGFFGPYPKLEE
jgi:hypothetical protein